MSKTDHARKRKTAQQRAIETHGIAKRRVEKLTKDRDKLQREANAVNEQLAAAEKRLAYVSADPDLADPPQMSLPVEGSISMNTEPS